MFRLVSYIPDCRHLYSISILSPVTYSLKYCFPVLLFIRENIFLLIFSELIPFGVVDAITINVFPSCTSIELWPWLSDILFLVINHTAFLSSAELHLPKKKPQKRIYISFFVVNTFICLQLVQVTRRCMH